MAVRSDAVNQKAGRADMWIKAVGRRSDAFLAGGVILLLVMMVVPLPSMLLDLLIVANLTLALVTIMVSMYTKDALEVSVFPSLLLIATLFRLALNVSSTRLILLDGYAGQVIQQFGQFVVGGNAVVGLVVFLILIIIQFVVITKGAERVAEVAARFTLDAMPGKQMSIDADLNAGLISEGEARERRKNIAREADFYGAMDGASKFVKGDAIAAVLITIVNIFGGLIVGMAQRGLSFDRAAQQYTLLTVGDGLASQLPALLLATATGLVVTRAASEGNLGQDMALQLFGNPRVQMMAALVLGLFALVPGLPSMPFFLLSGLFFMLGRRGMAAIKQENSETSEATPAEESSGPEDVIDLLQVDPLEIELGFGLLGLANAARGGHLLDRVAAIRRQMASEMGIVLPLIRVRDNVQLPPGDYLIKLRGVEVGKGSLMPDHYLAMNPGSVDDDVPGIPTSEPAFGLQALWVREEHREQAELGGYTVVDAQTVLATHLTRVIRRYGWQLVGRQETKVLMDNLREQAPALVDEVVPDLLKVGDVQKVLRNLLREGVSIRDLATILEALADRAGSSRDAAVLTEYARQAMAAVIAQQLPITGNRLQVITLGESLESEITEALRRGDEGTYLALAPERLSWILNRTRRAVEALVERGIDAVILAPPLVRLHFRRALEQALPDVPVVSYGELLPDIQIEAVEVIGDEN
ncbi:MAG: flagellar biosynthesis protein FlhA [Thermaerobacterales bacterium]